MDLWQEVVTLTVTRVHLIGVGPNPNHRLVQWNTAADTPCITMGVGGTNCEIAGFSFGGGATSAGIDVTLGTPMGLYIHDCIFGSGFAGDTPQDGIRVPVGMNATGLRVSDCIFLGVDAGAKVGGTITRDGFRLTGGNITWNGAIANCRFMGIPGVSINFVPGAAPNGLIIEDNKFSNPIQEAMAAGWAITLGAIAEGCMVINNYAAQTGDGTGLNPYRDLTTGVIGTCWNQWGMNYSGQAVIAPVTM